MSCPRCGFIEVNDVCQLCGQKDFYEFEMARYRGEGPGRFEFTLSFPGNRKGMISRLSTAVMVFASEEVMVSVLANMEASTNPIRPWGRNSSASLA